jgi:hypothetical protein
VDIKAFSLVYALRSRQNHLRKARRRLMH